MIDERDTSDSESVLNILRGDRSFYFLMPVPSTSVSFPFLLELELCCVVWCGGVGCVCER